MIKVFISHQAKDEEAAKRVARRLIMYHQIDCYLDSIDPYIDRKGEDLASHIRTEMTKCTQLIAVVSDATKASQWVPWEIGVATEKDYPLATFSAGGTLPPEFLRKWPYLRDDNDLDRYAVVSKATRDIFLVEKRSYSEGFARTRATKQFYSSLRSRLGQ